MTPSKPPVLVRSREIWREPAPTGGAFREQAIVAVPPFAMSPFGVFCVDTTQKVVSLTYDDGPDPDHTPRILDVLAERKATATFFVLAEQVAAHPGIARRIVAEGHELALHGWDHTALTRLTDSEALRRIRSARALVEDATGETIRLFRPPYGKHTWRQAVGIRRLGLELIIWSGHAWDWIDGNPTDVAQKALSATFPGAILLLHDHRGDPETLAADEKLPAFDKAEVLERVLKGLFEREFTTLTSRELVTTYRQVRSALRDRMARE